MSVAYLDASALVKLFKQEPETGALVEALSSSSAWMSSELVAVEVRCAARRLGRRELVTLADAVLEQVQLVPCTPQVQRRAGEPFTHSLRALDAIHAATVLDVRDDLGVVFAYDADLAYALAAEGVEVSAPAPQP